MSQTGVITSKGVSIKKPPRSALGFGPRPFYRKNPLLTNKRYPTRPNVQTNPDVPDLDLGSLWIYHKIEIIPQPFSGKKLQTDDYGAIVGLRLTIAAVNRDMHALIVFPPQDPCDGAIRNHWVCFLITEKRKAKQLDVNSMRQNFNGKSAIPFENLEIKGGWLG